MKKQHVLLTIITILFTINVILTYKMLQNSNEYEQKLNQKDRILAFRQEFVRKKQDKIDVLIQQISEKDLQIKTQQNEIHKLKKQLQNAKTKSVSPTRQVSRGTSNNPKAYFLITAYTAGVESTGKTSSDSQYGLTASGTMVKEGRTIACPPSYPFGTKMKIDGIGYRVCEDRGGTVHSGHIDLYIENLNRAIEFGKKTLLVEILGR